MVQTYIVKTKNIHVSTIKMSESGRLIGYHIFIPNKKLDVSDGSSWIGSFGSKDTAHSTVKALYYDLNIRVLQFSKKEKAADCLLVLRKDHLKKDVEDDM